MVCYAVPLAATLFLILWRRASGWHTADSFWLNIMMAGGAVFGLIDHAFTGELFVMATNMTTLMTDLALGGFITAGITACWGVVVLSNKFTPNPTGHVREFKKSF